MGAGRGLQPQPLSLTTLIKVNILLAWTQNSVLAYHVRLATTGCHLEHTGQLDPFTLP